MFLDSFYIAMYPKQAWLWGKGELNVTKIENHEKHE